MESTELTSKLSQIEQYCPDWAKEILSVIIQMPYVQVTYSVEEFIWMLKREMTAENSNGIPVGRNGKPRFGRRDLRKLQMKAERLLAHKQKKPKTE